MRRSINSFIVFVRIFNIYDPLEAFTAFLNITSSSKILYNPEKTMNGEYSLKKYEIIDIKINNMRDFSHLRVNWGRKKHHQGLSRQFGKYLDTGDNKF